MVFPIEGKAKSHNSVGYTTHTELGDAGQEKGVGMLQIKKYKYIFFSVAVKFVQCVKLNL